MKLFWGVAFAALLGLIAYQFDFGQEGNVKVKMYYVPIEAETLTPITSANIEERGRYCEINSATDNGIIKSLLSGATKPSSHKFSNQRVRVKLIDSSTASDKLIAFVEKEGAVRFADGSEGTISPSGMKTLKNLIDFQCRKVRAE